MDRGRKRPASVDTKSDPAKRARRDNFLKILIMNAGGGGRAVKRRKEMQRVAAKVNADVIFLQEAEREDRKCLKEKGYQREFGRNEAAVMVKGDAEEADNQEAYNETIREMTNSNRGPNKNIKYFENGRVASCFFEGKILCVSWHSRHTGTRDGTKKDALIALLKYIHKIKGELPFILGGDFNMDSNKVRDVILKFKDKGLKLYDADDKFNEKVMLITSCEVVALKQPIIHGQTDREKKDRILDHLQLEVDLEISSNRGLETVEACVSKMVESVLSYTKASQNEIARLTRLQALHLLTADKIFKTCVTQCIHKCPDTQTVRKRAKKIIEITKHISLRFLKSRNKSTDLFILWQNKIDETTQQNIDTYRSKLIQILCDMFEEKQKSIDPTLFDDEDKLGAFYKKVSRQIVSKKSCHGRKMTKTSLLKNLRKRKTC